MKVNGLDDERAVSTYARSFAALALGLSGKPFAATTLLCDGDYDDHDVADDDVGDGDDELKKPSEKSAGAQQARSMN